MVENKTVYKSGRNCLVKRTEVSMNLLYAHYWCIIRQHREIY